MSARIVVAALTLVCAAAVSAAEAAGFATVLMQDGTCVVRHEGTEKVLFKHAEPSRAIEWALEHSRIAVLSGGQFTVKRSVTIPRPGVSLVIAPGRDAGGRRGRSTHGRAGPDCQGRPLAHSDS